MVGCVGIAVYLGLGTGPGDPAADARLPLLLMPRAMTIARGVHLLGGLDPGAAYVVETSAGIVLVDSGMEADARSVGSQLAALGLDRSRLKAILLTHAHVDHIRGAAELRRATGARIHAGAGDCGVIRTAAPPEALFSIFRFPGVQVAPTPVDVELSGDEVIEEGDVRIRAIATPGHTPGSICYLMERGNERFLFTGDTIMTIADGQGSYSAYHAPRYRGNARSYLASLKKLKALPAPDYVLPGHPRSEPEPQSPQITSSRWEGLLGKNIDEMERLVQRYEADGEDFLDGTPRQILPGLRYLGDYRGHAVHVLVSGVRLVLFDAPGDSGLPAFLDARLREAGLGLGSLAAVVLTSYGPEPTAGLHAVVERTRCTVVGPAGSFRVLRAGCPVGTDIRGEDTVKSLGLFDGSVIAVEGRAFSPRCYLVSLGAKTVLVSGGAVLEVSPANFQDSITALSGETGVDPKSYSRSLMKLSRLRPDVWLPSRSSLGRNANLYGSDWSSVVAGCERLVQEAFPRARRATPR